MTQINYVNTFVYIGLQGSPKSSWNLFKVVGCSGTGIDATIWLKEAVLNPTKGKKYKTIKANVANIREILPLASGDSIWFQNMHFTVGEIGAEYDGSRSIEARLKYYKSDGIYTVPFTKLASEFEFYDL